MAAGATYTPIATSTLGSASNSVTFSSIPSTYTDLVIICNLLDATSSTRVDVQMQVNSDTGTNYSSTIIGGTTASGTNSQRSTNSSFYTIGMMTDQIGTIIIQLQNYANTTTYKSCATRTNVVTVTGGAADYPVGATVGTWRSTSAINSVKVFGGASHNFASGSTFTLYGVTAA